MSDPSQQCPSVLREITTPHRVCGRRSGKLWGVTYTTGSEQYDQGCGRINRWLPVGTCWLRLWFFNYLDGISVTHGSPRQHIWSFIGGYDEQSRSCPCVNGSTVGSSIPSFVGQNYFCESGLTQYPGINLLKQWSPVGRKGVWFHQQLLHLQLTTMVQYSYNCLPLQLITLRSASAEFQVKILRYNSWNFM